MARPDAGLDALLLALDPDREKAAQTHEELRRRLRRFFEWRGARCADELTDETMDRVGRRLAAGNLISADEIPRYCIGVARNVLREFWRRRETAPGMQGIDENILDPVATADMDAEVQLECLERCLGALAPGARGLVLGYYSGEGRAKAEARRTLAAQLQVTPGTLRIRVYRLRLQLETCVRACIHRATSGSPRSSQGEGGWR